MLGYTTLTAAFASSIFSAATGAVSLEFGVSTEVGILGVSLYVLGMFEEPRPISKPLEANGKNTRLCIRSDLLGPLV